jgi:hypothetical protein
VINNEESPRWASRDIRFTATFAAILAEQLVAELLDHLVRANE